MKQAFEVMSVHPLLTLFLGMIFIFTIALLCELIEKLFKK